MNTAPRIALAQLLAIVQGCVRAPGAGERVVELQGHQAGLGGEARVQRCQSLWTPVRRQPGNKAASRTSIPEAKEVNRRVKG